MRGDITITFKGKPPLKEWLKEKCITTPFKATNEYPFGVGKDLYFKVWDFTFEDKGN